VQRLRREAGLGVTDRIRLTWHSLDAEVADAIARFGSQIAGEVLATEVARSESPEGEKVKVDRHSVRLTVIKADRT